MHHEGPQNVCEEGRASEAIALVAEPCAWRVAEGARSKKKMGLVKKRDFCDDRYGVFCEWECPKWLKRKVEKAWDEAWA